MLVDQYGQPIPINRAPDPALRDIGFRVVSGYGSRIPKRGTRELLAAYKASPMLRAVASKIAAAAASVEWYAAVQREDGTEERLDDHIATRLLTKGTRFMSGYHARMTGYLHRLLVGEAFDVLDFNVANVPAVRWPIPPHWVREVPAPGREWFDIVPIDGGQSVRLPMDMVLWRRDIDPEKPYQRGAGVAAALADELNADEYAAKHLSSSLANRARPDIIISGSKEQPLNSEDVERVEAVWTSRFQGAERASKPFFTSGPINVQDITPSFRELDLTGLRAYERDIIVTVFGIPPEIIGILQNSNRATIESAEYHFAKHTLVPLLEADEAELNAQLAPQYDPRLRIRFVNPVAEDKEFWRAVMGQRPDAFLLDEHRALADHDELPDGAGQRLPLSFTTEYVEPTPTALDGPQIDEMQRAKGVVKATEDDVSRALGAVDDDLFASLMRGILSGVIEDFADDALAEIGVNISFDLLDPRVVDFLGEKALERAKLIGETTRSELRSTLTEGVRQGESTNELVKRIRSVMSDATPARARTISRTEIVRGSNFGTTEAHRQAGIEEREWLATADDRVRDSHRELDGTRKGIDEPFVIDGDRGMFPGDFAEPEHSINCRCAVTPIVNFEGDATQRAAVWKVYDRRRRGYERAMYDRVTQAFQTQEDAVIRAFTGRNA